AVIETETEAGEAEPVAETETAWGEAQPVATDEPVEGEAEATTETETQFGEADTESVAAADGWSSESNPDFPAGEVPEDFEVDREAAFAAIQAAAEAAASAEVATDAAARAEAVADIAIEIVGSHEDDDPRVSAMGLTPDFDAAEAEAATTTDDGSEIQEI